MNEIYASKNNVLNIGFMGEDNRTRVHFPISDLQAEYPGCSFVLLIKRAGDNGVYVVEPVISGDEALWTVEDGFLANNGEGEAVLICSTGTVTAKRKAWKTWTDYSLSGGVTPPADFSTWVTELLQAGADVQAAVDAFNEITAEATEGEQTSAYIDWTGDHPVLRIVIHSGGGGSVTVDDALSGMSENPVQNKVVKNALDGKYTKPQTGIPSTDMSQAVQTSLEKADTAIQEHQDISGKQNKPAAAGTAGQVLGLDGSLNPVWKTPYPQNYELIADITLTEDTDDLVINKFSDNSQLLITDFILQCDFKAAPSSSYLGAIWKDANNVTQYMPTGQMLTDSDKTAYYWTERFGNMVRMFANRPYEWDATTYDQPYYYNMFYDSPTIREVNLYKYSSSAQPIPAGSRIRLWGVRA